MWALISSRPSSNTWNRPTGPAPTMTASVSIGPSCEAAVVAMFTSGLGSMGAGLLLQFRQLAGAVFPVVGIGQRGLALGDAGPHLRELRVQRDHVLLVAGHVFLRHDRVDRALRDAHG